MLAQHILWAFSGKWWETVLGAFTFIYCYIIQRGCFSHHSTDLKSLWLYLWHGQMFNGIFETLGPRVCTASASWYMVFLQALLEGNAHAQTGSDLAYSLPGTPNKMSKELAEECTCSVTRMWPVSAQWVQDFKILWNVHSQNIQLLYHIGSSIS